MTDLSACSRASLALLAKPPSRRQALALIAAATLGSPLARVAAASPDARPDDATTGFDAALLDLALQEARELDQLHCLVVARAGEIAVAEAFRGPAPDRAVNIKSVSKTIVATLVAAALDRGVLESVDQRFADIAGDLVPKGADPKVRDLTLAHLLTMQAGLERTSGPNYGRWVQSPNWVEFALTRPFIAEPGARMLYSTGCYHLLGVALARASGHNLHRLARDWLGDPLGIEIPPWTRDPQGFYLGGNNMALSPLALLRLGELHRLAGVWNGTRVFSDRWIEAAWTPRTRSPYSGHDYGYGWFLSRAGARQVAYARGYGGQMLYVVPSLDLTVVVTSDPTRPARSGGYAGQLHALLADTLIPAAEQAPGA